MPPAFPLVSLHGDPPACHDWHHGISVDTEGLGMNSENSTNTVAGWVTETQLGSSVRFDLAEVEAFIRSKRRLLAHVERQQRRATIGGR